MNINHLNEKELEQLQELLNKMNPPHPIEKLYLDPVNKMIDDIIENMDWDRIQSTMEYLGWKWCSEYVTIDMLKEEGERLLRKAAEGRLGEYKETHWELGTYICTGGFEAQAWCNEDKTQITSLDLSFVLNSWDAVDGEE
mgnify:FL=1|tara:strand:+ start:99 stop:518 length:420 start_codon:yes stop_codon:yes gene_type:complete